MIKTPPAGRPRGVSLLHHGCPCPARARSMPTLKAHAQCAGTEAFVPAPADSAL